MGFVGTGAGGGGKVTAQNLSSKNIHANTTVKVFLGSKEVLSVNGNENTWHIPKTGGKKSGNYFTFDISNYPGHEKLNSSNFIVAITKAVATRGAGGSGVAEAVTIEPKVQYTPNTGKGQVLIHSQDKAVNLTLDVVVYVKD